MKTNYVIANLVLRALPAPIRVLGTLLESLGTGRQVWQSIRSGSPRRVSLTMVIIFLSSVICNPTSVLATSSTPSAATSTASATPSETQDIQEKIRTLVKENVGSIAAALSEKINLQILVGYVGTIKSVNSGNITIDSKEGTLIQITTGEKTTYIKSGAVSKLSSLAITDKIIIIGTLIKDDIILAKRIIVVIEEPDPIISDTVVAKISSLDLKKKIIGLSISDQEVLFSLTKKSTIKLDELQVGQTIFAITKKYQGKDLLSRAKAI